jgi:L-erythro-3,5-diaminohexanoate dehydrogenase
MAMGSTFGCHRVVSPAGVLPQPAWQLDNRATLWDNEILIAVDALNVDAASFTQIRQQVGDDPLQVAQVVQNIVAQRGKLHNPVTGSGGMLIGRVAEIGKALRETTPLQLGQRIATMVSLSLTPLHIERVRAVHLAQDQIEVDGHAILFESGLHAVLPDDLPDRVSLAILDVAGAPAQTARLVQPGDTVLVIGGGGKSGTLCTCEARRRVGPQGVVMGASPFEADCQRMRTLSWVDHVLQVDATDAVALAEAVSVVTHGRMADVVINCVNRPHTEMGAILCTKERGRVYFFSMATSFTAAALGAEGVGKDIDMLVGNGYARGNAEHALNMLREFPALRQLFETTYAG